MEIFREGAFQLNVSNRAPAGLVDLLNRTEWGTRGFRYTQGQVAERLPHLKEAVHYALYHHTTLIGNITFDKRITMHGSQEAEGYYVRYFVFHPAFQAGVSETKRSRKSQLFQQILDRIFEGIPGKDLVKAPSGLPAYHYAVIDANNTRSAGQAAQFGFEPVRDFSVFPIFRKKPATHDWVQPATPVDRAVIRSLLRTQYADHHGWHINNLFYKNRYYALKSNEIIYAGCQATVCEWNLSSLGPHWLNAAVGRLQRSQRLKRYLETEPLRFVTLDSFYVRPGYEASLDVLIRHILNRHELHWAFVFMDTGDPLYNVIRQCSRQGMVGRFLPVSEGKVWVRNISVTPGLWDSFSEKPWFLSGFDLS